MLVEGQDFSIVVVVQFPLVQGCEAVGVEGLVGFVDRGVRKEVVGVGRILDPVEKVGVGVVGVVGEGVEMVGRRCEEQVWQCRIRSELRVHH